MIISNWSWLCKQDGDCEGTGGDGDADADGDFNDDLNHDEMKEEQKGP